MAGHQPLRSEPRGTWSTLLFVALVSYHWISVSPFVNLTGAGVVDPSAGSANPLSQMVTLASFIGALAFLIVSRPSIEILQPRRLLAAILGWSIATSVLSTHPDLAIKRVLLLVLIVFSAHVAVLLPRSERQFAKLSAVCLLLVLGLCYFGVAFLPSRAIHQAAEILEPMNAGLWRGLFSHKNAAAGAMILIVFFGLHAMSVWSRAFGALMIVAAVYFLFQTGGKTALAVLPAVLLIGWVVERHAWARVPVVVGGLLLANVIVIGAAVWAPIGELIRGLGIDATFTNRADIWKLATSAIAESPLIGRGFQSFWQTDQLVYSGGSVESWAVAAYNGHNSYLDTTLALGIPGLILTLVWLVALPLRDLAAAQKSGNSPATTRLYMRIWLYAIFVSCLESIFYQGGGGLWFCLLIAVFGLRLQGRTHLIQVPARTKPIEVSYA